MAFKKSAIAIQRVSAAQVGRDGEFSLTGTFLRLLSLRMTPFTS
jgi:hypothetical protein